LKLTNGNGYHPVNIVDPETLNLLQKAIREGISSASWTMLITAVISAGFGAFLGSYLQRKGEDLAMNENFKEVNKQVTDLAQITEGIKQRFAIELKEMDRIQAQHVFVRELYAPSVREYSSEQAVGLREAYLLLFEPGSSLTYSAGKHFEGDLLQIGASLTQLTRYTIPGMGPCRSSPVGQTGL
jgi:hypothetical protein